MKIIHILGMLLVALVVKAASPIEGLLERIDKGASRKFMIEQVKSPVDFFELDQKGDKVVIRGNNYVSIATGLNWYLKYHVGIHLSWNGMQAELPEVLPAVSRKERHETDRNTAMTQLLYLLLYDGLLGLDALGERDRLDGVAWH